MKSKLLVGLSICGLVVFSIQADTLRLRDGRVITGTFQSATRDEIRFQRDGGPTDRYDVGSVDSITFGNNGNNNSDAYPNDQPGRRDNSRYQQRDQYGNPVGSADPSRDRNYNDRNSNDRNYNDPPR